VAVVSPGSSYLYGTPFHHQKTSHQAPEAPAKAYVTEILGKVDEAGPEPARGGSSPQESAGPATRAFQMVGHYQWWSTQEAGLIDEPRPAAEVVEDRLSDWLSRWTGSQPMR